MALARSDEVYDFRSITFQFSMKTLSKMAFTYVHIYVFIKYLFNSAFVRPNDNLQLTTLLLISNNHVIAMRHPNLNRLQCASDFIQTIGAQLPGIHH